MVVRPDPDDRQTYEIVAGERLEVRERHGFVEVLAVPKREPVVSEHLAGERDHPGPGLDRADRPRAVERGRDRDREQVGDGLLEHAGGDQQAGGHARQRGQAADEQEDQGQVEGENEPGSPVILARLHFHTVFTGEQYSDAPFSRFWSRPSY